MQVSAYDEGDQVQIARSVAPTLVYAPRWGFHSSSFDEQLLQSESSAVQRTDPSGDLTPPLLPESTVASLWVRFERLFTMVFVPDECITAISTFPMESGLHYWEVVLLGSDAQPFINIGICADSGCDLEKGNWSGNFVSTKQGFGLLCATGAVYHNNKCVGQLCEGLTSGDVVGLLLDCTKGSLQFFVNNSPVGTGFDQLPKQRYRAAASLWQQGDGLLVNNLELPMDLAALKFDQANCSQGITLSTDGRAVQKSSKVCSKHATQPFSLECCR